MRLYWSDNHWRHSNTHSLPPIITITYAHCKCFRHSKSTSCTHLSLPTLQIYLLYSHITSYTPDSPHVLTCRFLYPNVRPTLTCFHLNLKMAVYSLLFEMGISLRVFLTEILSPFCLPIRSTLPAQRSLLLVTIVTKQSD